MSDPSSSQRLIENEAIFREANENIEKGLRKEIAKEEAEGVPGASRDFADMPLSFYCECADENCQQRVVMTVEKYRRIHKDRKQFIVSPNHEVAAIEQVVMESPLHTVVKKFISPPENPEGLNYTETKNV
jgi:hypothetical protein